MASRDCINHYTAGWTGGMGNGHEISKSDLLGIKVLQSIYIAPTTMYSSTHTHLYIHVHICTPAHIHICAYIIYKFICICFTYTSTYIYTCMHAHIHTQTHIQYIIQTDTTHTYTQTDRQTHTHIHYTNTEKDAHVHACMHAHRCVAHIQTQTDLLNSQHSIHWALMCTDSTSQLVTSPVVHQSISSTTVGLVLLLVKHHTQHCSGWTVFTKHTSLGCKPTTCIGEKSKLLALEIDCEYVVDYSNY